MANTEGERAKRFYRQRLFEVRDQIDIWLDVTTDKKLSDAITSQVQELLKQEFCWLDKKLHGKSRIRSLDPRFRTQYIMFNEHHDRRDRECISHWHGFVSFAEHKKSQEEFDDLWRKCVLRMRDKSFEWDIIQKKNRTNHKFIRYGNCPSSVFLPSTKGCGKMEYATKQSDLMTSQEHSFSFGPIFTIGVEQSVSA